MGNLFHRSFSLVGTLLALLLLLTPLVLASETRLGSTTDRELGHRDAPEDEDEDMVDVIVGFKGPKFDLPTTSALPKRAKMIKRFRRIKAESVRLPRSEVEELLNNPDVEYVEEDVIKKPLSESMSWAIPAVQADSGNIPLPSWDNDCFKICVVDSGLNLDHPDIPYNYGDWNIDGADFSLPSGQHWYNPWDVHGTHVTGTMIAQGGNNEGIVGVIPNNQNMCLLIARTFDDDSIGATLSTVNAGVEWCADMGAKVINMSLGGPQITHSEQSLMESLYDEGIIVVSAAGNDGNSVRTYPGSFREVLSVGGVDPGPEFRRGDYSNYNPEVDIVAPGTSIQSTIPGGDYLTAQGTSMACPFVTAVIAKVWAARPECSHEQVREAIKVTAMDLGPSGKDDEYGHGLIQAEAAYNYLLGQPGPCGGGGGQAPGLQDSGSSVFVPSLRGGNPGYASKDAAFKIGGASQGQRGGRNSGGSFGGRQRALKGSSA